MKPSYSTISDELSALHEFYEIGNWRFDSSTLVLIRTMVINLLMLEEGFLTDEEDEFLGKVFVDVTQYEAETR
jgi:hypothetical protein